MGAGVHCRVGRCMVVLQREASTDAAAANQTEREGAAHGRPFTRWCNRMAKRILNAALQGPAGCAKNGETMYGMSVPPEH